MAFGFEVKKARLSSFLNQTEFAEAIGVSFTTVNRWENGKAQPNLKAMKALKSFCTERGYPYELLERSWHEAMMDDAEF